MLERFPALIARAGQKAAFRFVEGKLEVAHQIPTHESPRTTKLCDRNADKITLDEIERIAF